MEVDHVVRELRVRPPLVTVDDVRTLRVSLARVARGQAQVVQAGDCAEDPAEATAGDVARKAGLLDVLAGVIRMNTRKPVIRVGRIAGQYGKPRSRSTERVGDGELPVYRGHMVNAPEPDPPGRRPDPWRMLLGYDAARETMRHLGWSESTPRPWLGAPVWTSHEALLLDYEIPLVRIDGTRQQLVLTSTHWPWVGERTRDPGGAHVQLLSKVINPVACKIGPSTSVEELVDLCRVLDPGRDPGRLTLIARMGADAATEVLPGLVTAVREAGHPVIWLSDPMHGNTVTTRDGAKTRFLATMKRELRAFQRAVRAAAGYPGGLHLETTPDEVLECVADGASADELGDKYTSLCDPRLNPMQAVTVVSVWGG